MFSFIWDYNQFKNILKKYDILIIISQLQIYIKQILWLIIWKVMYAYWEGSHSHCSWDWVSPDGVEVRWEFEIFY